MIEGMPARRLEACFICGDCLIAPCCVTDRTTGVERYAHVGCYGYHRLAMEIRRPGSEEE